MGDWLGTGRIATHLREYLPFEEARIFARGLGLKSQSEWDALARSGGLRSELHFDGGNCRCEKFEIDPRAVLPTLPEALPLLGRRRQGSLEDLRHLDAPSEDIQAKITNMSETAKTNSKIANPSKRCSPAVAPWNRNAVSKNRPMAKVDDIICAGWAVVIWRTCPHEDHALSDQHRAAFAVS
jgi:hypothetical protein